MAVHVFDTCILPGGKKNVCGSFFTLRPSAGAAPRSLLAQKGIVRLSIVYFTIRYYSIIYYAVLYCKCLVIACTTRHGQIVFTVVAPQSSLAQRGMARMRMLVVVLGHYLQGEAWPD